MAIKLLHMYHDIMNLYGEYGNIKILEKHIKDQGYDVVVDEKTAGDYINLRDYDFVYIGSGTERNQDVVLEDLIRFKDELKGLIEEDNIFLCTGNSYEMFGKSIDDKEGLNIFDFEVSRTGDRITSDVIYASIYLKNKIVGFINKMGVITHNLNPFFNVEFGVGENEQNNNEGVKYKNFYGTYVIGPILVRNPELLEMLVKKICEKRDNEFKYKKIEYENENKSYKIVLEELSKRKK